MTWQEISDNLWLHVFFHTTPSVLWFADLHATTFGGRPLSHYCQCMYSCPCNAMILLSLSETAGAGGATVCETPAAGSVQSLGCGQC